MSQSDTPQIDAAIFYVRISDAEGEPTQVAVVRADVGQSVERQLITAQTKAQDYLDTLSAIMEKLGYTEEISKLAEEKTGSTKVSDCIAWWVKNNIDQVREIRDEILTTLNRYSAELQEANTELTATHRRLRWLVENEARVCKATCATWIVETVDEYGDLQTASNPKPTWESAIDDAMGREKDL